MKPAHGSLEQAFVDFTSHVCVHTAYPQPRVFSNNGRAPQGTGIVHMAWLKRMFTGKTHIYTHSYTHVHTFTHTCTHTHTLTCTHACTHKRTHTCIDKFQRQAFFGDSGAISSQLVWVGRTPLSTYPFWVPTHLLKIGHSDFESIISQAARWCLGMEPPARALDVKGKGIVVRQPFPSVPPQPLLQEQAMSSQASCVKNPSVQKQKKKKRLKLIFTSFNFKSYSWHERIWKRPGWVVGLRSHPSQELKLRAKNTFK